MHHAQLSDLLTLLRIKAIQYNMITLEDIRKDPTYQEFCENRMIAAVTAQKYQLALSKYVNLIGKPLEVLLDEADQEEEEGVRLRKRKIKKYLLSFKQHLDETDLSESYKRNLIMCVRTFYNENGIEIPKTFRKNARSDRKNRVLYNELPTMDDIKHILTYANSTFRAIILLGVSSGMSRAEICSLTFKDFFDAITLDPYPETLEELVNRVEQIDNLIPLWQISRVKTGTSFFTFNSPEASDAILDYLKDLNRKSTRFKETEIIKSEFRFNPETKLFRNSYLKPMSPYNMSRIYEKLNGDAGFEKVDGRIFIRPHSLRKVFASTLEKHKMPHLMIRWIMGHGLDQTTGSYFKADPLAIKEEYLQILDQLTTDNVKIKLINNYDSINEELEQKEQKIQTLEATINNLTGRVEDMEEIKVLGRDFDSIMDKLLKDHAESKGSSDELNQKYWEELKKLRTDK